VWGRYAKIKGAKPGEVAVTKDGALWRVKGRIDSVAPGTEGDWAAIDGVVERISPGAVQIRGEVAVPGRQGHEGHAVQGGRHVALQALGQIPGLAARRRR
jgi:hypothetical protein